MLGQSEHPCWCPDFAELGRKFATHRVHTFWFLIVRVPEAGSATPEPRLPAAGSARGQRGAALGASHIPGLPRSAESGSCTLYGATPRTGRRPRATEWRWLQPGHRDPHRRCSRYCYCCCWGCRPAAVWWLRTLGRPRSACTHPTSIWPRRQGSGPPLPAESGVRRSQGLGRSFIAN